MSKTNITKRLSETVAHDEFTIFTIDCCEQLVKKDSRLYGPSYVQPDNVLLYCACCNTWYHVAKDYDPRLARTIRQIILKDGLIEAIKMCDNASDSMLSNGSLTPVFSRLTVPTEPDRVGQLLLALRYPKRLSPQGCESLASASMAEFRDRENRNKMSQRSETCRPWWLIRDLQDVLSSWSFFIKKRDTTIRPRFSSGVSVVDCNLRNSEPVVSNRLPHKVSYLAKVDWQAIGIPCPSANLGPTNPVAIVTPKDVPKSWKARRIICECDAVRSYYGQQIREQAWQFMQLQTVRCAGQRAKWSSLIPLDYQEQNRHLAALGSVDGSIATIDIHSASDSINWSLVQDIFPKSFVSVLRKVRIDTILYVSTLSKYERRSSFRDVQMAFTSGDPLTFTIESLVFCAITLLAADYCYSLGCKVSLDKISVYGDDIVCPVEIAETVVDLLQLLGFEVSVGKSYISSSPIGYYRESCGIEALNGHDVSPLFISRKTSGNRCEFVASLCALQHRIYHYEDSCEWLTMFVRALEPRMTCSTPGEFCDDLWYLSETELDVRPNRRLYRGKSDTSSMYAMRERHLRVSERVTMKATVAGATALSPWSSKPDYEAYLYSRFLQDGPRYASALDKLLGVSLPNMSYEEAVGKPESFWEEAWM